MNSLAFLFLGKCWKVIPVNQLVVSHILYVHPENGGFMILRVTMNEGVFFCHHEPGIFEFQVQISQVPSHRKPCGARRIDVTHYCRNSWSATTGLTLFLGVHTAHLMAFFSAQTSSLKHSDANCTQIIIHTTNYTRKKKCMTWHNFRKVFWVRNLQKALMALRPRDVGQSLYYLN